MGKMTRKVARGSKRAARKLEAKVMEAIGRRVVRSKTKKAVAVGKKAVKRALIAGGLAAAGVVVRELRKKKRD